MKHWGFFVLLVVFASPLPSLNAQETANPPTFETVGESAAPAPASASGPENLPSAPNKRGPEESQVLLVPHPDLPLEPGRNSVWAATFQQAWQSAAETQGGELTLANGPAWVGGMSNPKVNDLLPTEGVLAFGGLATPENVLQLTQNLYKTFPVVDMPFEPPALVDEQGLLLAGYVQKNVIWQETFQSGPELSLTFPGSSGSAVPVAAYGFPIGAGQNFTRQVEVLGYRSPEMFAVRLQTHNTYEYVVLARGNFGPTITDTVQHLRLLLTYRKGLEDGSITKALKMWNPPPLLLGPADRLVIPEIRLRSIFSAKGLLGVELANAGEGGSRVIQEAQQGVALEVGPRGYYNAPDTVLDPAGMPADAMEHNMEFSGPFSVSLWQKGALLPYLFVQVGNADLLKTGE